MDSRGRDKKTVSSSGSNWQRLLLVILFFCGPVGTVISFLLLPKDVETVNAEPNLHHHSPSPSAAGGGARVRMVHLSLADSDRRARFVLDENTVWDVFLSGCRERLQVKNIRRVTDSSGEAILAVEDLVHDDHLVIYATPTDPSDAAGGGSTDTAPALPGSDDLGPSLPLPLPALSTAAVVGSKSRVLLQGDGDAPPPNATEGDAAAAEDAGPSDDASEHATLRVPAQKARPTVPQLLERLDALQGGGGTAAAAAAESATATATAEGGGTGGGEHANGGGAAADHGGDGSESWTDSVLGGAADTHQIVGSRQPIDGASYAAAVIAAAHDADHAARGEHGAHSAEHATSSHHADVHAHVDDDGGAAAAAHTSQHSHGAAGDPTLADDPLFDHDNPSKPCGKRHPTYRLAMLIPWVNDLPPWLSYFVATAQRSEYLVDWLIFHETLTPPRGIPSNVKFIDLGAGGLSQLIGLKMGEELGMPVRNASLLIRSMRFMLEKWPRLVAEYKPAFGTIFEQYLGGEYTHWGYCDLDMVIGNLPLYLEAKEFATQDIVSYSFGDMDALYLRGQWTMHRNRKDISTIWKRCPHLGDELQKELLMKVAWVRRMESRGVKNYPKRFQSAEGCYSHRATQLPGIRIKVAHKQFVGLSVPSDDMIFAVNGAVWQCPKASHVDVNALRKLSTQPCSADLPGVQEPLGELLPLEVTPDGGCGKWMPYEYRMCALNLPEPPERERDSIGFNTYYKDGQFFAQRFRATVPVLDNGCKQGSFFHMQEWKKIWGYGSHGVDPLELVFTSKTPPTFTVTTEGISLVE